MDDARLPAAAVLILAAVCEGPLHGYAIGKDIQRRTDGEVKLGATSLYRLIRQLLDSDCLQEAAVPAAIDSADERRRYFRITSKGRRALDAEMRRLRRILTAAESSVAAARRSRA